MRLLAALLLLCAVTARAEPFVPSGLPAENLSVSLVTFQPGSVYWQRFGHDALVLRDSATGAAVSYNYGYFDFRQKNFFLNFARGRMVYRMLPIQLERDLAIYAEDGRWAREQRLALDPMQRGWLRDYLAWNARPENADYRYDYFIANCATRVRDAIDGALGGRLRPQLDAQKTAFSYRLEALRLIAPDRAMFLGMDAALGPTADQAITLWQQSFAPLTLMAALRDATVTDAEGHVRPLVLAETELLPGGTLPDPPALPPDLRLPFLLAGLALAGALLLLAARWNHLSARIGFSLLALVFALLSGTGGLILAALWGLTEHWAGWRNENLLLLNPLGLLLIPAWLLWLRARWQPGPRTRRLAFVIALTAALPLLLHALPGLYQANLHWLLLTLPVHAALAFALARRGAPASGDRR